jgi:hypothetical protein
VTIAICLKCGASKVGALAPCASCGFEPTTPDEGAFIEDEWEAAIDRGADDASAAQARRARDAYERSLRFGTLPLEQKRPRFAAAQRNADTIKTSLADFTAKADAESLLWVGAGCLSRGSVASDEPAVGAGRFVGVALLERAVELDEGIAYGTALAALGAYHARSPEAELAEAKRLFERALTLTNRGALTVQLLYAQNCGLARAPGVTVADWQTC